MKYSLMFFFIIVFAHSSFAQFDVVTIEDEGYPQEPTIMMDFSNPSRMMAAINNDQAYYSLDTGRTWTETVNYSEYGIYGDPVLMSDTNGSFYYLHLSGSVNWLDRIVAQRIDSLPGDWLVDSYMGLNGNKDQDKEWATVDRSTNNLYVTWTEFDSYGSSSSSDSSRIRFSKSTNRGVTWSEAIQINEVSGNCVDDDLTTEGAVPCVGPNGEVYVSWAGPAGIVFDRSFDQGETWLTEDIFIDSIVGGWAIDIPGIYRCNGMPVTKCDTSGGPNHGTIYVNWTDQRNGEDDTDVWLSKSTDQGDTWSEPTRVNNDPAGRHQFFSWMDVDQVTGKIYVVFYDRRNTTGNYTDFFLAASEDGGETFENIQLNTISFLPSENIFVGDYTNIVAYDGIVRPIWVDMNGVSLSIKTALIQDSSAVGTREHIFPNKSSLQIYPNPVDFTTKMSMKLRDNSIASLGVYDLQGKKVVNIISRKHYTAGKHVIDFGSYVDVLVPGHYILILKVNGTRKKTQNFIVD